MQKTFPLSVIVKQHQSIKRVVLLAHQVNLLALNALILVKQSNGRAAGFGVVSTELLSFSSELSKQMAILEGLALTSVRSVSEDTKQGRSRALLARAQKSGAPLDAIIEAVQRRQRNIRSNVQTVFIQIRSAIEDAELLCRTAQIIASTAKIQAAWSLGQVEQLMALALSFEDYANRSLFELNQLGRTFKDSV